MTECEGLGEGSSLRCLPGTNCLNFTPGRSSSEEEICRAWRPARGQSSVNTTHGMYWNNKKRKKFPAGMDETGWLFHLCAMLSNIKFGFWTVNAGAVSQGVKKMPCRIEAVSRRTNL